MTSVLFFTDMNESLLFLSSNIFIYSTLSLSCILPDLWFFYWSRVGFSRTRLFLFVHAQSLLEVSMYHTWPIVGTSSPAPGWKPSSRLTYGSSPRPLEWLATKMGVSRLYFICGLVSLCVCVRAHARTRARKHISTWGFDWFGYTPVHFEKHPRVSVTGL